MNPATLNVIHVVAMYAAYIGSVCFLCEASVDYAAWRAKQKKRQQDRRVLASIAHLKPLEPEILQRLYANSAYAHRRTMGTRLFRLRMQG